jgi:transcriptional regulator with XRE-family HTH domain
MRFDTEARDQFATNLRARRDELGCSQEALAQMCDLDRTTISLLERSKRSPTLDTIVALARALELDAPAGLLGGID